MGTWCTLPNLPHDQDWEDCVLLAMGGFLYVLGTIFDGSKDGTPWLYGTLHRYDEQGCVWMKLPSMTTPRSNFATATSDGCLYALGGEARHSPHSFNISTSRYASMITEASERFDSNQNTWQVLSPMAVPRSCCAAAAAGGRVYIVGGHNLKRICTGLLEVYDIANDSWANLPHMPTARSACACAVVGGGLYVFGGSSTIDAHNGWWHPLNAFEKFDIAGGAWLRMPSMPTPRSGCTALAVRGFG